MKTIRLGSVLSEINQALSVFDITYTKDDGSYGEKKNVALRNRNDVNERRKRSRSGVLSLWQPSTGHLFDVTIDLLRTFNNMRIIRNYDEGK